MSQFAFRIISKTAPSPARQRQLAKTLAEDRQSRSTVKRAVRKAIESDPELREQVEQAVQRKKAAMHRRHLERPIERGGDRPALLVEHGDGTVQRIDHGAGDPRKLEKTKRPSFRDVFLGDQG
jgi:hypothetical protein